MAWHQGMTEWKALGELTQGKLVYQPEGYVAPTAFPDKPLFRIPALVKFILKKKQYPIMNSLQSLPES